MASQDHLTASLESYTAIGKEYRLKAAQKCLTEGFVANKAVILDPSKMETMKKQKIDVSFRNFSAALRESDSLRAEYEAELQRTKQIQEDRLRFLSVSSQENTSSNSVPAPNTEYLDKKIAALGDAKNQTSALLQGLFSIYGVKATNVQSNEDGSLRVRVDVGTATAEIAMSADMKVTGIQADATKYPKGTVEKIQSHCTSLPAPQDFRYAIFALSAAQNAWESLMKDVSELRQKCLVNVKQMPEGGTYLAVVQITLGSGITVSVGVDECYPEVPGGVHVLSTLSTDHESSASLSKLTANANSQAFRSLPTLISFLISLQSSG